VSGIHRSQAKETVMADGDVETINKRGQWVNHVVGEPELSQSFTSRAEAIAAGRTLAAELKTRHLVEEDIEPSGQITDQD
jgi:hypothetical protein